MKLETIGQTKKLGTVQFTMVFDHKNIMRSALIEPLNAGRDVKVEVLMMYDKKPVLKFEHGKVDEFGRIVEKKHITASEYSKLMVASAAENALVLTRVMTPEIMLFYIVRG